MNINDLEDLLTESRTEDLSKTIKRLIADYYETKPRFIVNLRDQISDLIRTGDINKYYFLYNDTYYTLVIFAKDNEKLVFDVKY